jgi:hypothetical protein
MGAPTTQACRNTFVTSTNPSCADWDNGQQLERARFMWLSVCYWCCCSSCSCCNACPNVRRVLSTCWVPRLLQELALLLLLLHQT